MVVVGSPRVLLNTEQHMVKLYGDKGKCWSLYLKSCLEHGTLIIPRLVEPDRSITQRFKEQLAAHLGATLPIDPIFQSSRPNYRTCPTRDTNVVSTSNMHVTNSTGSISYPTQSRDSHHVAIHAKSGIRLVHKPLSSDENVLKQMSQVKGRAPINLQTTTSTYSHPATQKRSQWESLQKSRAATVDKGVNQSLNNKSTATHIMQKSRSDCAGTGTTISSNKETACANLAQSVKLDSSTQLSKSPYWQNNSKSERRGK